MSLQMTASHGFAQALVEALDQVGWTAKAAQAALNAARGEPTASASRSIQPPTLGAGPRLSVSALEEMFNTGIEATGDPTLPLRAGHRFRVSSFGRTGSIYAHANDLPDVILLNSRYQRLAIDLGDISEAAPDKETPPRMVFRPHVCDPATGLASHPHCVSMLMGAYVTAYRWLNWGSGEDLVEVAIPIALTASLEETASQLLRCPVKFGGPTGYLAFTERAMATPLTTSDPEKRALSLSKLDDLLGAETGKESFQAALHAAIRGALGHSTVSIATVAARLDLSESQFRRQLRDYGWTFRAQTDAVRQAIMAEHHRAGDSLATIALALGYNDQAAFNRAVKRWYGVAPGQWRPDMAPLKPG